MGWWGWLRSGHSTTSAGRRHASQHDLQESLLDHNVLSMSIPASENSGSLISEEQRYVLRRIRDNPMWTLDRGTGFYQQERLNKKKASLLGAGKNAGKSNVQYQGIDWMRIAKHVWKRDFFTTAVHSRFQVLVLAMVVVFISSFLFWACIYYTIWKLDDECFLGFNSFLSAFLFSIETQNTIGYGSHAIGDCWLPAWLVGIQCIFAVLLEAIFLGIIFAKISHPKGRSRTILISECACIARRDGILKFMFRVADIRKRTTIAPRITASLYTWGPGHTTAEGEQIPVTVQALPLHYMDTTLLLPVVVEHTIDERSPLYGHTTESLEALNAEIVVTFDGHSELGDSFMSRQSYLPSEIHWGCVFVNILRPAQAGSMQHSVNLSRFHDIEPQPGLRLMPPHRVSKAVVLGGARRIPRPRLGENTLLLSDELVVTQAADGRWFVAVRVGDAYPSQMCSASITMFIYRYNDTSNAGGRTTPSQTYTHQELPLTRHLYSHTEGPGTAQQEQQQGQGTETAVAAAASSAAAFATVKHAGGGVNVLLRYPVVVGHEIGPDSPLREWTTPEGLFKDADAEIVVVASATQYITSRLAMRSKVYSVLGSIRWGYSYAPCVVPPKHSPTGHALVDWSNFHDIIPVHPAARNRGLSAVQARSTTQSQFMQQYRQGSHQAVQQHAAADAYCAQVEDVVESWTGHQHQQQQQHQDDSTVGVLQQRIAQCEAAGSSKGAWQQPQQQRSHDVGSAASAPIIGSSLQSVIVTDAEPSGAVLQSNTAAVAVTGRHMQQKLQQVDDLELYLSHSVGFADLHSIGQLHAGLQACKKEQQQQQQSSFGNSLQEETPLERGGSASSMVSMGHGQQGSDECLSGSRSNIDSESLQKQHQRQRFLNDDEHTLTLLPQHRQDSWADKRRLAGVLDLFNTAVPEEAASDNAGNSPQ